MLVEALKLPKRDGDGVRSLHSGADAWYQAIRSKRSQNNSNPELWTHLNIREEFLDSWRVRLGLLIRYIGSMWEEALVLSLCLHYEEMNFTNLGTDNNEVLEEGKRQVEEMYQAILEYNAYDALNLYPPFNGNEVSSQIVDSIGFL